MYSMAKKYSPLAFLVLLAITPAIGLAQEAIAGQTGTTGMIIGTVPTLVNSRNESGRIDVSKDDTHAAGNNLDIGDKITLSWQAVDAEQDEDATLPSVIWRCTMPGQTTSRVMAIAQKSYVVLSQDKGCTISLDITPTTSTGVPRENEKISISDISAYDDRDNIPTGIVNPYQLHITQYTVAPNTTQSKTVDRDALIQTAWNGATLQLTTDNMESQVTWSSSDESVASVTDDGRVTFKSKGKVTFTAMREGVSDTITFDPQLFYVFNDKGMTWNEAHDWCESLGYVQPSTGLISTEAHLRNIPQGSLWQEWGNIYQQGVHLPATVLWSSTLGSPNAHRYVYLEDGHISSNGDGSREAAVCVIE